MVTLAQAKKLIKLARKSITTFYENTEVKIDSTLKKEFSEKTGVFVSLYLGKEMVGCIGYPTPKIPLWKAVVEAARAAAFSDPRFAPLKKKDSSKVEIELSILTKPEVIEVKKPSQYLKKIKIGKHGLMIRDRFGTGLLLPQVAKEWNWNAKKFLEETCRKASLSPDAWDNTKRNVYWFQTKIYSTQKGKLVAKKVY